MNESMRIPLAATQGPGWYPDPTGRHAQRYFDGKRFTAHVASVEGSIATEDIPFTSETFTPAEAVGRLASGPRTNYFGFLPAWRPMTYIVLAFNLLMLVWMMNVSSSAAPSERAAAGAVDLVILFLTAIGDVILGVIYVVTRPERRA